MSILFLGYFNKNNLGDDVYQYLWNNYLNLISLKHWINELKKYKIVVWNPNDIKSIPNDTKIIIWGGGDIVNTYFFEEFNKLLYKNIDFKNGKIFIYILSFGITYNSNIDIGLLDYCDFFITRSNNDLNIIQQRYWKWYNLYLPD